MEKVENIKISLIDIIYGIVLSEGFTYFDNVKSFANAVLYIFTFAIIVHDYFYFHINYWDWQKEHFISFVVDILILFTFYKMFQESVAQFPLNFWLFFSFVFLWYILWDISTLFYQDEKSKTFNFRIQIIADTVAFSFYFLLWLLLKRGVLGVNIFTLTITILAYIFLVIFWYKKT